MYTTINLLKNICTNLELVLSVLALCTIAIKLGHAGIVDLSVKFINTSLQNNPSTNKQITVLSFCLSLLLF